MNGDSIFVALTENLEEAKNVKPGDVVTVKYNGVNIYEKLQQPMFYRVRQEE